MEGIRVSPVKPSNCFRLHPTSMISKHSTTRFLQAPWKISFTFHFWHKSFILDYVKLAELYNNSFEWKNVTFLGGQNILWPFLHIFRGSGPLQPPPVSMPLSPAAHYTRASRCDMNTVGKKLLFTLSTAQFIGEMDKLIILWCRVFFSKLCRPTKIINMGWFFAM